MIIHQWNLMTQMDSPMLSMQLQLGESRTQSIKYNARIVDYNILTDKTDYEMVGSDLLTPKEMIIILESLNLDEKVMYSLKLLILDRGQTIETIRQKGYEEGVKKGLKLNKENGYDKGMKEGLLLMNQLERPGMPVPQQLREYVYSRDKGKCQCCGKKLKYGTAECTIDHIIPRELGGSSLDTRNLQLLCQHCNSVKGSRVLSNSQLRRECVG